MCKSKSQRMYERAKEQEIQELIDKMGSRKVIEFQNDDEHCAPCVLCTHHSTEIYLDCSVLKVSRDNNVLSFLVKDEFGDGAEIGVGDIEYGHIDFITSAIPAEITEIVKNGETI